MPKLLKKSAKPKHVEEIEEIEEIEEVVEAADDSPPVEIDSLETRMMQMEEALANAELRIVNINQECDGAIKAHLSRFIEMAAINFDRIETSLLYKVIDFFQQSPFWETKKIADKKSTAPGPYVDPGENIHKLMKEGWRYMGHYFPRQGDEPYSLFARQKGAPLAQGEYLKMYEDFQHRLTQALAEKKSPKSEPKTPVASKVKIRSNKPKHA